jgi:hypothetical protein
MRCRVVESSLGLQGKCTATFSYVHGKNRRLLINLGRCSHIIVNNVPSALISESQHLTRRNNFSPWCYVRQMRF